MKRNSFARAASIRTLAVLAIQFGWPFTAWSQACEIDVDRVNGIKIGASTAVIREQLSSRYDVAEVAQPGAAPTLIASPRRNRSGSNSRPEVVISFVRDRAFLIDSYEPCATKEGIGPGTRLAQAQERYGRGNVDPTEKGYFIWFERKKGVMFLLDDRDIPRSLRGIQDDVITPAQEGQILGLGKAKIIAVRLAGPEN